MMGKPMMASEKDRLRSSFRNSYFVSLRKILIVRAALEAGAAAKAGAVVDMLFCCAAVAGVEASARSGKREEGIFKRGAGDLEVTQAHIAQQHLANHVLHVSSGDDDRIATLLHTGDAGQCAQRLCRKPCVAANPAARSHALDLRGRTLADDLSLVDDDDPMSQCIGLLEIVRRQQH